MLSYLLDKELPSFLRPAIYKLYANTFGVNISEALNEDLTSYPSLADFFARPLKEGIRAIDRNSCLVSPCDGTVLHFGTVHTEQIEQVKSPGFCLFPNLKKFFFLGKRCYVFSKRFSR